MAKSSKLAKQLHLNLDKTDIEKIAILVSYNLSFVSYFLFTTNF